jgi:NAD(P)-dependent dehydrogenase (short-subunit alcohol dehydrogenase family)
MLHRFHTSQFVVLAKAKRPPHAADGGTPLTQIKDLQDHREMKKILVTGANTGIGLALCKQLAEDHGCFVYLCSRNQERGEAAVASIGSENVKLVILDVSSDASVAAAAEQLKGEELYAIVNNAGIGLVTNPGELDKIVDVNLRGAKRVTDAFLPLLQKEGGRIALTSSGAASSYVGGKWGSTSADEKACLVSFDVTWSQIEKVCALESERGYGGGDSAQWAAYGVSKACLTAYGMLLARENPKLVVSSCSPGFIKTNMTRGYGAKLEPKDGTASLKHCLLGDLGECRGWYYGSDGLRSPLHFMRSPGEPVYDGAYHAPVDAPGCKK